MQYTLIVDVGVATNSTCVLPICSHLNSRSSSDSWSGKQRLELLLLLFYKTAHVSLVLHTVASCALWHSQYERSQNVENLFVYDLFLQHDLFLQP